MMDNEQVDAIRQSHRYEMTLNRKKLKHAEADLRRPLADMRLSEVDLPELAKKLKTKSEVTETDLRLLKNILIQDEKNIQVVLNTQGALRGLVRELSGSDVNRQVEAAGCLCNLALADSRGCITIIKAAGAYLVAALDSQNLQLAVTSAWSLGNLAGSGPAAGALLARAGAAPRLCARAAPPERARAARYALTHYAHAMGDQLSDEHLALIVKAAGEWCEPAFRLYYIVSCRRGFQDPGLLRQIVRHLPDLLREHHKSCVSAECCDVLWAVRALANLPGSAAALRQLQPRPDFTSLVKDPRLRSSVLWLCGNLLWRQEPEQSS